MALQIFINSQEIDLYDDEKIEVTDKVQDVKDISKLFTSFSNTFSIPGTKKNNKIFKHYYNSNIVGGFDASLKVPSIIKVNGQDFKKGNIEIAGTSLKDNVIDNYKIIFVGEGTALKD